MTTGVKQETYRYGRLPIPRFGVTVPAVMVGRVVYFPVRSFCQVLGVAHQTQKTRLKENSRIAPYLREVPVPSVKGLRPTLCIHREKLAEWLDKIDPSHCKLASTRELLNRFQDDVSAAADGFLWGRAGATVYDEATKTDAPITGVLHVGHCPGCGMALCVTFDQDGAHLRPDPDTEAD